MPRGPRPAPAAAAVCNVTERPMSTDGIEVAATQTTAYVRVRGRATFKLAPAFKDYILNEINQGRQGVLVDMFDCCSLDSTFAGTITSLTLQCRKSGKGCLKLFNVPAHVRGILDTLGLAPILEIVQPLDVESSAFQQLDAATTGKVEVARLMFDAHETLAELNEKNALEFKNVLDQLRSKLQ